MTKPEHLRRFLAREGYAILLEQAVRSGRFVYTVFSVEYTGEQRELSSLESFVGGGCEKGIPRIPRLTWTGSRQPDQERAEGLEKSSGREAEAAEYRQVIRQLEQWMEEGKA